MMKYNVSNNLRNCYRDLNDYTYWGRAEITATVIELLDDLKLANKRLREIGTWEDHQLYRALNFEVSAEWRNHYRKSIQRKTYGRVCLNRIIHGLIDDLKKSDACIAKLEIEQADHQLGGMREYA